MDERTVRKALQTLKWDEAAVLYWRCQGKDAGEIGAAYHYHESAIWNRLREGRRVLEAHGIKEDPCQTLLEYGEPSESNWPPPNSWVKAGEVGGSAEDEFEELPEESEEEQEEQAATIEPYRPETIVIPTEYDEPPRRQSRVPWIIAIVAILIAAAAFFRDDIFPPEQIEPAAEVSVATQEVPEIGWSDVPTATNEPTSTPEPTNTPEPTETPEPTLTPTPENVYYDDFSDGIDEGMWNIEFGSYEVLNDVLVATEYLNISIGDETWQDYEIELETANVGQHLNDHNFICVRCTNRDGVYFEYSNRAWSYAPHQPQVFVIENGDKRLLQNYQVTGGNKLIQVRVIGNQYEAFIQGREIISYQLQFDSGPIIIGLAGGARLKSVRVTRLD